VQPCRVEIPLGAHTLTLETGKLAKQAAGAVVVQYGDTVILAAVCEGRADENKGFFPLMVDYREKTSAAGKFPGGFIKREGRPTTKEILTSRLCDRPIRPLFPPGYINEVQIMVSTLSADKENDPDVLAMIGCSACLHVSHIPFLQPTGSVRVARVNGEFVVMPTYQQLEDSDLDLMLSGTRDAVAMIEGFARELPEDQMVAAIEFGHKQLVQVIDAIEELREKAGLGPKVLPEPAAANPLIELLRERHYDEFLRVKQTKGKMDRAAAISGLKDRIKAEVFPKDAATPPAYTPAQLSAALEALEERVVRDLILEGVRIDGRAPHDLRAITCEVSVLPRTHGSGLFQRGETQALVTTTLGTVSDEQRVDGLQDEFRKKFMLDYNFPPFSVGETKPIRGPGRREIGHGALAERSLKSVIPPPTKFPYTIRLVSDILESNGSSSMASVCGGTLALMDAGVPITNPVAGISIGLVKEPDRFVLLTDIMGDEDHYGDMDFKVAGTQRGITGIQLDLKISGIDAEIIRATLKQARDARIAILKSMLKTIIRPKAEISRFAPRLLTVKISPDKIGLLIGPGGKTIKGIQEETGAKLDIEEDGTVFIAHMDSEGAEAARRRVEALCEEVRVGKVYDGKVSSIKDFGAFIEILPGRDGLCHISELADGYVSKVDDVVKVGDRIQVKVIAIDDQDRVKLSRKALLREQAAAAGGPGGAPPLPPSAPPPPREPRGEREPRREGGRGEGGGGRGRGRREEPTGEPGNR
jgi:polyribonucleotide nucleotidyltransferase